MSFYGNLQLKAAALLAKFGQDVGVRRTTQGTYDATTSRMSTTTATTIFKGALFDFGSGVTEVNGSLVKSTDKRLLLDGAALPTVKDVILIGSTQYSIISIKEINPAGTPVIFDLHLRK